jgi:hypothetical protein
MTSCMVWGVEPASPLSRSSHGAKPASSLFGGESKSPCIPRGVPDHPARFFFARRNGKPRDSGSEVEEMLGSCRTKIVQIKRGTATTRRNPSSAILCLQSLFRNPLSRSSTRARHPSAGSGTAGFSPRALSPYRATAVASATSNAVMLTIRRTVADAVSTCTG